MSADWSITIEADSAVVMKGVGVEFVAVDLDEALDYIRQEDGPSIEVPVTELDGYETISVT